MKPEIEAKFLNIDHDAMRGKLRAIGAACEQPSRLMRRRNYDFPDRRLDKIHGWVRVRDEGDGKVTLSYKQMNDRSLTGTHEVQLDINDYDTGAAFLESIGLVISSDQETKRESWRLGEVQIELDEWPWATPYMEIEGPDEQSVKDTAVKLGLDWAQAKHGSVEVVYQAEYNLTEDEINHTPVYRFSEESPQLFKERKK